MHSMVTFLLVLAAAMGHLLPAQACCFSLSEQPQEKACCARHQEVRVTAKKSCCHQTEEGSQRGDQSPSTPLSQTPECCCSQGHMPATVPQESHSPVTTADIALPVAEFQFVVEPRLNVAAAPECSHPRGLQKLLCRWLC